MDPKFNDWCLYKRKQRGLGHRGYTQCLRRLSNKRDRDWGDNLQAKEQKGLTGPRKSQGRTLLYSLQREHSHTDTWVLDFWTFPQSISVDLSNPVRVDLSWQP